MAGAESCKASNAALTTENNIQPARLPVPEICVYVVAWLGAVVYAISSVYTVSQDSEEILNDYDLVTGWSVIGRRKDASNFEWYFLTSWFWEFWPWLAGHFMLGRVVQLLCSQWRKHIYLLYSLVALYHVLGHKGLLVLLTHCSIALCASLLKSVILVWIVSLGMLSTLNFHHFLQFYKLACDDDIFERKYYLLVYALAMSNIRYISCSLEWCNAGKHSCASQGVKPQSYTCLDSLLYLFYLPLFLCGPVMTFDDFHRQINRPLKPWTRLKVQALILDVARIVFWICFAEVIIHFFYFSSIQQDTRLMQHIPLWALAGTGYCNGQFFMVKYVVFFGVPASLARTDQLNPPKGPRCISWIYLYSKMWRYFDRGFYSFIKRYVFIPLGGTRHGFFSVLVAFFVCFAFVCYWHGAEQHLMIWTALNFMGVSLEYLGMMFVKMPPVQEFERAHVTPAWGRRLRSAAVTPHLQMSALAIFYFLGGMPAGEIYVQRLIKEGWGIPLLTQLVVLYCCVQTAKEIERWQRSHTRIKQD